MTYVATLGLGIMAIVYIRRTDHAVGDRMISLWGHDRREQDGVLCSVFSSSLPPGSAIGRVIAGLAMTGTRVAAGIVPCFFPTEEIDASARRAACDDRPWLVAIVARAQPGTVTARVAAVRSTLHILVRPVRYAAWVHYEPTAAGGSRREGPNMCDGSSGCDLAARLCRNQRLPG